MPYDGAWCSAFASAVAIKCGYTEIIPTEVSCYYHIELFKKLGCWVEDDNYVPKAGDYILYDWEDAGKGDNVGSPNHIGIVEKVVGNTIHIIDGNNSNDAVGRRTTTVGGKYIRGFGVPKYAEEESENIDMKFEKGNKVIINGDLYYTPYDETPRGHTSEKITYINRVSEDPKAKHPYNTTGDLGWMDEKDIKLYEEPIVDYKALYENEVEKNKKLEEKINEAIDVLKKTD